MKFVLTWTNRGNSSAKDNLEGVESSQKLVTSGWQPGPEATMREWLFRCDGSGGFAVLETDDPGALYRYIATGNPWLSFEVRPVLDVTESTPKPAEAIQTAKAAFSASRDQRRGRLAGHPTQPRFEHGRRQALGPDVAERPNGLGKMDPRRHCTRSPGWQPPAAKTREPERRLRNSADTASTGSPAARTLNNALIEVLMA